MTGIGSGEQGTPEICIPPESEPRSYRYVSSHLSEHPNNNTLAQHVFDGKRDASHQTFPTELPPLTGSERSPLRLQVGPPLEGS